MARPNVLWICTDQQRWDTLSFLGHPGARTPNIDRLAAEGTAFDRAYCQSPICTPSRASFLSGKYPIATGVQRNGNVAFPDDIVLVPRMFRDAGYRTGLIGKLHLSRAQGVVEKRPADDGYDEFYWSHHPGPGLGAGGARLRGLARGEGRRRGGDLRSRPDARGGRGRRAPPDDVGGRPGEAVHPHARRAAVVPVDQPLRSASAVRSAGGLSREVRPGGDARAGLRGVRPRPPGAALRGRPAVAGGGRSRSRRPGFAALRAARARGRRERRTTRRPRPTTASWCGPPTTR